MTSNKITKIKKRDGRIVDFDQGKITNAIYKALTATGQGDGKKAKKLSDIVVRILNRRFKKDEIPTVEQIQDIVEEVLILEGLVETAKAYILYREQRRRIREATAVAEEAVDRIDKYLEKLDWEVQENANMTFSLQGLNHYATTYVVKKYWLNKIYPKEIREANESGDFHLHNLDSLSCYCMGWDLYDLLIKGFGGVPGKIECKPPKHFRSALGQVVNFLYTLQGECAGAVAFSNFDTLLAPFIRYDNLNYQQVKQALQEFLFNMAIPTRVGFQCISEDTQILTPEGWKSYYQVKEGDEIYTFNLKNKKLEIKKVKSVFKRFYKGKMYNLINRNQNQLISPRHRVVRRKFNTEEYILEPIEKVLKLKSSFGIPTPSVTENNNSDYPVSDRQLELLAWILSEETVEKEGSHRISIYQSPEVHLQNYQEIVGLLSSFNLEFTQRSQFSLGNCLHIRLSPSSSKIIHQWFGRREKCFPSYLFKLSKRQARIFLQTYLKGDGWQEKYRSRIVTSDKDNAEKLMAIGVLAGYNVGIKKRKKISGISKKEQYIVTFTQSKDDYIQKIKEVDYQGVIWSVHTDNETVIAKRNGQVFITGNTPFSNITLDLRPSSVFEKMPVIIGGKPQKETYGEFSEEMKIFDKALYEVMLEGDKTGRPFHFPIPTINITPDFPWDEPAFDGIFEASAKYGTNYFANYINSEMKPSDVRSMCCRLRLDLKELHNRGGGGLFGSGSLTGCYDDKTEILTEDGWKLFKDLTKEDYVFTLTEDNRIELHQPRRLFEYDYQGKMIHFKSKSVDLLVTPNHRMVVDHKGSLKRMFVEAKDFNPYQHYIPKGGVWKGEEKEYFELPPVVIMSGTGPVSRFSEEELESIRRIKEEGKSIYQIAEDFDCSPATIYNICTTAGYGNKERLRIRYETPPLKIKMDDWLKFFGFWLAEGCTDNERIALDHGYRVVISQTNKKKREEIKRVLNRLPFNYYEEKDNFIICNKQLWSYLRQFGNKYQKFIPKEIKNLSRRQLKILFDWMVKGDGHIRRTTGQINYWTSSKKLADDLQEIILKLGWMGTLTSQKKKVSQIKGRKIKAGTVYALGVQKTKHYVFRKKLIREVNYTGKVYCCEVPNHTVFVRRNGKVAWCGNSIGVVTINLPRIGYLSKTKKEFFERLEKVMDLAKESLEIKRKAIENFIEKGLYPYSRYYLSGVKKMRGAYYGNHFSTIGLVGMNEALLNFIGEDIGSKRGIKFALEVLDFMRNRLVKYQEETGNIYNLEATPAESSLAPNEKVLISQSDPKMVKIGSLIDKYFKKNKEKIQIIGNSEVLPLPSGELFTYGFSRKNLKVKKYPVTALIRHPGDLTYQIETISGRKVKVTRYHSVFTLNERGFPEEVKVSELKKGDVIAIPKRIEMEINHKEFNLIEEFRRHSHLENYLYLKTSLEFIEKLIKNEKVKEWAKKYYKSEWKDVKCMWRKNKVVPLKLIYESHINLTGDVLENSKIFYRKNKNTSFVKTFIKCDKNLGFLLGILLAEGWLKTEKRGRIEVTTTEKKIFQEIVKSFFKVFGNNCYWHIRENKRGFKKRYVIVFNKIASLVIKEIFNLKEKSKEKKIPNFCYFAPVEFICNLVRGFALGDGSEYLDKTKRDYNWRLYTNSKELAEGLNILLLRLGILAKFEIDRKDKYNPKWNKNYVLSISGIENLRKFYQLILNKKFKGELKNSGREKIPKIIKSLKDLIKNQGLKKKDLEELGIYQGNLDRCVRKNNISSHLLKEILEKLEKRIKHPLIKNLKILLEGDLYWDPIKSIKKVKVPKYVYDFEVNVEGELVENFLGGQGLVSLHNTAYRLALKDKQKYPDIITAGTKERPYYTNSTQLPVNYTDDIFKALKLQDEIQCKYTGGTVFHIFLGERIYDISTVKNLVRKIFEKFHLPYITLTPTFSICPVHGYIPGEHFYCPKCTIKQPCEVYTRVVGYYRPVQQFNEGKREEYKERKEFKIQK